MELHVVAGNDYINMVEQFEYIVVVVSWCYNEH